MVFLYVHLNLPAEDEREADVERKVELVDVVKVIKHHCDGHVGGPWGVEWAIVSDARIKSYRAQWSLYLGINI